VVVLIPPRKLAGPLLLKEPALLKKDAELIMTILLERVAIPPI
jgi:hypothetical protein